MKIVRLVNEKVLVTFLCSMVSLLALSSILSHVNIKMDAKKASASVNNVKEELKVDMMEVYSKNEVLTERIKSYEEMSLEELINYISTGKYKMEYSLDYEASSNRLAKSKGAIYYNGHKETYYSEKVLPGASLNIPGRHVANDGTIRDGEGYIAVAANTSYLSKGTIVKTSLGPAKVYDSGCSYGVIDIYTSW